MEAALSSSPLSAEEASLRARIGAHTLHATRDSRDITAAARKAFLARFEDQVDPERVFSEGERTRRAEQACKAYFARLALASARARRRPAAEGDAG